MPIIRVTLLEGYDETTKERLMTRLTQAARATVAAVPEGTTVVIDEVKPSSYMRGGIAARARGPAQPEAAAIVRAYLDAMEARDLETAQSYLGEGFAMVFPGGARFTDLASLVAWSKPRYRFVKKLYESYEEVFAADETIVWCRGTLYGEWPDGTPFEGIRFVDRFAVKGGKIIDQQVWNDLAETLRR
jgi:phenylpyruvate tautomerase PptA (4-oxalocrotonate tautomerase family)